MIWIERRPGALWAVGRAVNPQHRPSDAPRHDDYLFEGYELEDALERRERRARGRRARARADGWDGAQPFTRDEVLKPLERWFFGSSRWRSTGEVPRGR